MRRPEFTSHSAAMAVLLVLSGCGERDAQVVRPYSQPLERLNSARARAQAASALPRPGSLQPSDAATMCAEVVRISEQGRLIVDRSDPRRLVVDQRLWARLPEEAQAAIVECAEIMRPEESRTGRMRVTAALGILPAR